MRPDRVIIGTESERAAQIMRELYRPLYLNETPMVVTTPETAEIIKYAANAFLATKITFINEIANLCEQTGANVQEVAKGIGLDGRIGKKFLHAGPGYGGSCFPKDTLALVRTASEAGSPVTIVEATIASNDARKHRMADKIIAACGGSVAGKSIGVLGLTFKPNTDDMRDAPSLVIVPALIAAGAQVRAFDPEGIHEARKQEVFEGLDYASDAYAAAEGVDALVILTEWDQFRALDLKRIAGLMAGKTLIDLRNIYKPSDATGLGFDYVSIGRGNS
jgi:UDPglucose 6-dehydrogenase